MKTNELRIGNWVEKLSSAAYNDVIQILKGREIDELITYMKPIPLTEQWLKDFGFELNHNNCYQTNHVDGLKLSWELNWLWLNSWNERDKLFDDIVISYECKYVHQLQNLYFALTGKELIKN